MKRNMANADRIVRAFAIAPILIVVALLTGPAGLASIVLYALAGIMLTTAAVGSCPLYSLLHVNTCPHRQASA